MRYTSKKPNSSLRNYPECDREVVSLANELWGKCDGKTVLEGKYGKGKIVWNKPIADVLRDLKLKPDFLASAANVPYIHRRVKNTDVYFVVNPLKQARDINCTFRVSGKTPELWDAETGKMTLASVYSEKDGLTTVPISFEPTGSIFVVFRNKGAAVKHFVAAKRIDTPKQLTSAPAPELKIQKAVYEAIDGSGSVDVTQQLSGMIKDNKITVVANNEIAGDPTPMHLKRLRVEYTLNGKPAVVYVNENSMLSIPESFYRMVGNRMSAVPASQIRILKNGKTEVTFWEPGSVTLTNNKGKTLSFKTKDVPGASSVGGPWKLRFTPNWGAPDSITLPDLISWTEHSDPGVRYFSGSATYTRDLNISRSMLGKGKGIYLDLGSVKNFAEVTINGKYLGIMWKPPFRTEITDFVHAGTNDIQIKVTNLWPNRLIGDEQLPDDREWNGMQLAKWPDWVLQGKPSPTGRLTFTTWHHYTKDSPLLESGLLGPVRLRPVVRVIK